MEEWCCEFHMNGGHGDITCLAAYALKIDPRDTTEPVSPEHAPDALTWMLWERQNRYSVISARIAHAASWVKTLAHHTRLRFLSR